MASSPESGGRPIIAGRDDEQRQLRAALERVLGGRGGLELIGGEAGIGKTTLVRELAQNASDQHALVLTGHCYDLTTTPPYGPWLELVRGSPRVEGLPSLSRIVSGQDDDALSPGRGDELYAWGLELFGKLAARQALVLVLEDIHWADRASLDFLRYLGRASAGIPALLIATYRAGEVEPQHPLYRLLPAMIRESEPARIDLHPLDDDATIQWIRSRYDLPAQDESRLASYLQLLAEGNPFFASEILRELEEAGVLACRSGDWSLAELEGVGVPILLRQVLETRLGHLSREAREALALAAVIGHDVEIELWRGLAGLSETDLLDVIEQAARTALIDLSSDGRKLTFRHALIREALYEDTLPPRRREQHREVAEALLEADDPDPDAVAHHLQHAGDPRAGAWLIKAGDRAYYRAFSLQTALARYEAALDRLPEDALDERGWLLVQLAQTVRYIDPRAGVEYSDKAEQIALKLENRPLRAVAIRNRGICRFYARQNAIDDILTGYDLIDALSDRQMRVLRSKRQGRRIDTALGRQQMAFWYATAGRYREAIETTERAFALLDVDSPSSASHAAILHWGAGLTYAALGIPTGAATAFQRSRDAFRATNQDFHAGTVVAWELIFVVIPYFADDLGYRDTKEGELLAFGRDDLGGVADDPPDSVLCPLYLIDGRWDALGRIERESRRQPRSVLFHFVTHNVLAEYLRHIGRAGDAAEYIRADFPRGPVATPVKAQARLAEALDLQRTAADLAMDGGNLDEARAWIDSREQWLDWSGCVLGRAAQDILEARHWTLANDAERADSHAVEAVRLAKVPRQPLVLLQAHRRRGETLTALGRREQAEQSLRQALELSEACRAPYERGLTQIALAELSLASEDGAAANRELVNARRIFARLGAEPALERLRSIQEHVRLIVGPTAQHAAGLSEREIEVLRLAAGGLTDRQIGEQLFISPRTVGQHMGSIFKKLDVSSRTAAAVRGAELGLLERNGR